MRRAPAQQWHVAVAAVLERQRGRRLLWVPVGLGLGAGPYAALAAEPPLAALAWASLVVLAVGLGLALAGRRWLAAALLALALPLFGMTAAAWETARAAQPLLPWPARVYTVTGTVADVLPGSGRTRVTLGALAMEGVAPADTPRQVRLSLTGRSTIPAPGDRIRLRARLGPAAPPAEPGGFDYQRNALYGGLGGSGYALQRLEPAGIAPGAAAGSPLARLRLGIDARVNAALDGDSAALATALISGHAGSLSPRLEEDMRDSGLAHLISISGLHVAMLAGFVMGVLRLSVAAWPWAALRLPAKKLAAGIALAAAVFYMLLVDAPVPTQRSVAMTGLVLLAIMTDRNPFSLRSIALAAIAMLLLTPSALVGPSAQMSFAAVAALLAGYEALHRRRAGVESRGAGWGGRFLRWAGGLALTSLIASVATAPFSLYHFQQLSLTGVVANMVAVPVSGVIVMPAGVLACLAMPLGLERLPLIVMGWGLDIVIATAHWAAALPAARLSTPAMPPTAFLCLVAAGLWWLLWLGRIRLALLPLVPLALAIWALSPRPLLLVGNEGRSWAVALPDGSRIAQRAEGDRSLLEGWLRRDGQHIRPRSRLDLPAPPRQGAVADGLLRCDAGGCVVHAPSGADLALPRDRGAELADCPSARAVIVPWWSPRSRCAADFWDRERLRLAGSLAVWDGADGLRLVPAREPGTDRPWIPGFVPLPPRAPLAAEITPTGR